MQTANPPIAFRPGDHIVYPAHGVGRVMGVEKQAVAGIDLDVFVISFEQDKMTLRVPTTKAKSCGMRALASTEVVNEALKTLQGRARIKRTMWSRRAQEYEAKINSGDLVSIAEVVRDLHRASGSAGTILFRAPIVRERAGPDGPRTRRRGEDRPRRCGAEADGFAGFEEADCRPRPDFQTPRDRERPG